MLPVTSIPQNCDNHYHISPILILPNIHPRLPFDCMPHIHPSQDSNHKAERKRNLFETILQLAPSISHPHHFHIPPNPQNSISSINISPQTPVVIPRNTAKPPQSPCHPQPPSPAQPFRTTLAIDPPSATANPLGIPHPAHRQVSSKCFMRETNCTYLGCHRSEREECGGTGVEQGIGMQHSRSD